jgi:hypothetical protein
MRLDEISRRCWKYCGTGSGRWMCNFIYFPKRMELWAPWMKFRLYKFYLKKAVKIKPPSFKIRAYKSF